MTIVRNPPEWLKYDNPAAYNAQMRAVEEMRGKVAAECAASFYDSAKSELGRTHQYELMRDFHQPPKSSEETIRNIFNRNERWKREESALEAKYLRLDQPEECSVDFREGFGKEVDKYKKPFWQL